MKVSTLFLFFGILCTVLACVILVLTFFPVLTAELNFALHRPNANAVVTNQKTDTKQAIRPINDEFGIVIPKIGANSPVIAQVDPYDSRVYQVALTKGVAQAKGSAFPGENGNMFLFSHSSANFYEALQYNSIFYLLGKLEKNDKIYVFYQKKKYVYLVTGTKLVDPTNVQYLTETTAIPTITLMTCWPAGTTLKRLLVTGQLE